MPHSDWPWRGLSEDDIARVAEAAEDLIETVGFRITHRGLWELCARAGAQVDEARDTVRFPRQMLRELLSRVPASYLIRDLAGRERRVGGDEQFCISIVTDPWIVDYATQSPRRPVLEDLRRHTAIAQAIPDVAALSRMDFPVADSPGPASSLRALETHLLNHDKHNHVMPANVESLEQWVELAAILGRGRSLHGSGLLTVGVAVISPLELSDLNAELLLKACAHGFAVVPTICPQAGATSPYSRIGTLLQAHAEVVFIAALVQLVNPGNPVLYAMGLSVTDMRDGHDMYYTLDKVLWKYAGGQLGVACGWPTAAECGGTMTFRYDPQCGAEGLLFMLSAVASGVHMLAGIGSCYNAVGMSAEMMVMQTAWLEAARHLSRGLSTDLLDRSIESIRAAGPGGNFLTDDLTLELLRGDEFLASDLLDHSGSTTGRGILERAHQRAEQIVAAHRSPVPEDVQADLRAWFDAAVRNLPAK